MAVSIEPVYVCQACNKRLLKCPIGTAGICTDCGGTSELYKTANEVQVGGNHYKTDKGIEHWDIVAMFKLDYYQGNITKYVMRWRDKGKVEDLKKARHYLDKYIELIEAGTVQ